MKFQRHVTSEMQELLLQQLKEYELSMPMSKKERKELHNWVSKGRSPYDNGSYVCFDGGYPVDFISALRADKEEQEWFNSLSAEEKEAVRTGQYYQCPNDTDEFRPDMSWLHLPEIADCDLPFQ